MLNSFGEFMGTGLNLLLFMVVLPVVFGALLWLCRKKYILQMAAVIFSAAVNLVFALGIYTSGEYVSVIPYAPYGFAYTLRVYPFSSLFLICTAIVILLIAFHTALNLKNRHVSGLYLFLLYLSFAMVNGSLLSDSLGLLLFFWEGLLAVLFGMLLIGKNANPQTAYKAMAVQGMAVLLLMSGIIVTTHLAGTSSMSEMQKLPLTGLCLWGFIPMMLGALGKCGCMPFHSWILSASEDAPAGFTAAIPGTLEKILGIYLAARIIIDIYDFAPGGGLSIAVMVFGMITLVVGSALAILQKNTRRTAIYCSVALSGLMVLGIGSGLADAGNGVLFLLLMLVVCISGLLMLIGRNEKVSGVKAGRLDPYNILMAAVGGFSDICTGIELGVSWVYDQAVPGLVKKTGMVLHRFDNGSLSRYLSLTVFGVAVITVIFLIVLI